MGAIKTPECSGKGIGICQKKTKKILIPLSKAKYTNTS